MSDNKGQKNTTISDRLKIAQTIPIKRVHKVQFIALKDEIKQAIEDGFSVKDIWRLLDGEKKITMTYRTLVRYTNKYINIDNEQELLGDNKSNNNEVSHTMDKKLAFIDDQHEKNKAMKHKHATGKTFKHNPVANTDDLY